jgi:hypothetical protein
MYGSDNTISCYSRFQDGGTTLVEGRKELINAGVGMNSLIAKKVTYTASSRSLTIQRRAENTSQTTTIQEHSLIVALRLNN